MNIMRVIPVDEPSPKSLKNIFSEILLPKHSNQKLAILGHRMRSKRQRS